MKRKVMAGRISKSNPSKHKLENRERMNLVKPSSQMSYHIHSTHSDGRPSVTKILEYAKKLNLSRVGISDHYRFFPHEGLIKENSISDLDEYINDFQKTFSDSGTIFMLGIEADFFTETEEDLRKRLSNQPFDHVIGAIHFVHGVKLKELPFQDFSQERTDEIIRGYWDLTKKMAESGIFDIVAHLGLTKRSKRHSLEPFLNEIDAALDAIKEANMTVELNTSGWYHPCNDPYPSAEILKKCFERSIPVMVTSDAHKLEHMTRGFSRAYELLLNIGFRELAYYVKRKRFFAPIPKELGAGRSD